MGYIPKSLVNTGLYTNGGEFTTTNGKPYKGYYHQLFDGEIASGKTPNSPDSQPLITNYSTDQQNYYLVPTQENINYASLQPANQELYSSSGDPLPHFPIITGKDYQRGQIIRYFAKKRNEEKPQIREIKKDAFNDLNFSAGKYNYALWTVTSVFWKISGPLRDSLNKNGVKTSGIIDTNRRLVENANKDFRGIRQYLSNLIQFAVKSELVLLENLYTGGNELTVKKDNSDYTGYYHIMGDKKIMDGATHEQSTGKVLLSADASFSNQLGGLIQTELGKIGAQDNVAPTNNSRTLQTQLQNNISGTPVTRQPSGGGGGGY
jgi:hypothetical protein